MTAGLSTFPPPGEDLLWGTLGQVCVEVQIVVSHGGSPFDRLRVNGGAILRVALDGHRHPAMSAHS